MCLQLKDIVAESDQINMVVMEFPSGEEGYYVWGYDDNKDTMVRLRRADFLKAWHFVCAAVGGSSLVMAGILASEEDSDACIPMGTRVNLEFSVPPGRNAQFEIRHVA